MTDLTHRLRHASYRKREDRQGHDAKILDEAADAIEALIAEVDALRGLSTRASPAQDGLADELEGLLERFGLVLTDNPDFDLHHSEATFERAKTEFVAALLQQQAAQIAKGGSDA